MKRSKRMTMKKKKAKFGTQRKWLESKRKKAGKQLNQELNMQVAKYAYRKRGFCIRGGDAKAILRDT